MASYTVLLMASVRCLLCLNPCCNGQWPRTHMLIMHEQGENVLILVVMDNGLVPAVNASKTVAAEVLILVVMDNGLVLHMWGRIDFLVH